jgi:hypothetical protein
MPKYDLSQPISNSTEDNAGGICRKILIAPKEWVDDDAIISANEHKAITQVGLKPGLQWIEIKTMQNTGLLTIEDEFTVNGKRYQHTLRAIIHKDSLTQLNAKIAFAEREFIVICDDNNKFKRLIGSSFKGMKVRTPFSTGTGYVDKNHYELFLSLQCSSPAPNYPF